MGKNYYISDLHFGHGNILLYDNRPFENVDDMETELIRRWNSVVSSTDIVYILGDFIWKTMKNWAPIVRQLNGSKVLITGNHDPGLSGESRKLFLDVKDYKEINDEGRHVVMCHYPILFYKGDHNPDTYMLCGHVHTTPENDLLEKYTKDIRDNYIPNESPCGNIYNVGCMMPWMDYTPRTLTEIIERHRL